MAGLVVELPTASSRAVAPVRLVPEAHARLEAAEAVWRDLEASPGVVMTPYQRVDWAAACIGSDGARPLIVVLRDPAGRPRLLLPFGVRRERGLRVARFLGGRHANYHMPVFACREAAALPAAAIRTALRRLGRAEGVDVFAFFNQPSAFDGVANPLAEGGTPSPSDAYGLRLGPDPDATMARLFSGDARRKLRQKEKWLAAAHGPARHRLAATAEEAEAVMRAYLDQKAVRFAQMRLPDPFAAPAARAFLAAACRPGPNGPAALECHALRLDATGRILATFIGAADARRFSAMLTSFDPDPALARFSPGDLLLHALLRDQAARGRLALDLGVGEAAYKAKVCDETIRLVDGLVPVTAPGRVFAGATRLGIRVKRGVKRNPRLRAMAERLRRLGRGAE